MLLLLLLLSTVDMRKDCLDFIVGQETSRCGDDIIECHDAMELFGALKPQQRHYTIPTALYQHYDDVGGVESLKQ